jgi:peptidoglycan/xylan/chitin deacetylase (PgdA/CDA1 family)
VSAVEGHVKDGDIILMHDIYDSSVDAALQVVDFLLDRGYCFVTVEQLLALRQVQPEPGALYTALPPSDAGD